jgi:hypothetical protein
MPDYGPDDPWKDKTPKYSYTPKTDKKSSAYQQTKKWFDILLEGSDDAPDKDFEVDTPSNTVLSVTTSTNPKKPRTLKAGYDFKTQTLTVVFRDGTWWEYREVPDYMWYDFQAATSKGEFLRESGLDQWPDMGPADVSSMPRNRRVQMNDVKQFAKQLYEGNKKD